MARAIDTGEKFERDQGAPADGEPAAPSISFEPTIRRYDGVDALPAEVMALLEREGERHFFNGAAWYRTFSGTCLDPGQRPAFHVATLGRHQVILPMLTPLGRDGSTLSKRQLGDRTGMSMTNYQSLYYAPVTNGPPEVLAGLLFHLARHLRDLGLAILDFNHLDSAFPENAALQSAFERAGFVVHGYADDKIIVESVDGRSYAAYMKDRSANLRHNVRRKRKRLAEAGEPRFAIVQGGPDLDQAIRDYETVQKASWKPDEVYPDHVPALIRAAADAGTLRLGLLYLDERPIATALAFLSGGIASIKKWHFDTAEHKHHVGDIVMSHMVEHFTDKEPATSIDLGKAAASHKVKWMKQERPMHGFVAFDTQTLQGQLGRLRFRSERIVRSSLSALKRRYSALQRKS